MENGQATVRTAGAIALVAVAAMVAATGSATMAAESSPPPSTTEAARICPAGHVVATTPVTQSKTPSPDATAAPLLKGSPPSDGAPKPSMLEAAPTDLSLGGTWSKLPRSPFAALNPVALWAGDRMVAIDERSGRTATYDPATGSWAAQDYDCPITTGGALSTGELLVGEYGGIEFDGDPDTPTIATFGHLALDPETGACYALPGRDVWEDFTEHGDRSWTTGISTGDALLYWSGANEDTSPPKTDGLAFRIGATE